MIAKIGVSSRGKRFSVCVGEAGSHRDVANEILSIFALIAPARTVTMS